MNNENKKSIIELIAPPCPICSQRGQLVRNLTVRSLIIRDLKKHVKDIAYSLCTNPDCEVSYYEKSLNDIFSIKDVKVPIWYKKNASPKYACYCNKITFEEAIIAAKETGLSEMSEIIKFLRGKVKCACVAMNPSGQCCTPLFPEAIKIGLSERQKS